MRDLESLKKKLAETEEAVRGLEEKIASHPDTILGHLTLGENEPDDGLIELASKVKSVRAASGSTDSSKNPVEWEGWEFTDVDGKVYHVRRGSNWCSVVLDCYPVGDWKNTHELDRDTLRELSEGFPEDPVTALEDAGITEPNLQVAYILMSKVYEE